jgi:SAM-dependent methyltransferase
MGLADGRFAGALPMSGAYPLAMSDDEITRLRVQSDLFRAAADEMLTAIGVRPGWRCLDLCCGIGGVTDVLSRHAGPDGEVVGLDADPAKLGVAIPWAQANGFRNVRFVQGDAFSTGLRKKSFDLVHARFALSIVPGGSRMLAHLIELTRPGGVIFLQEVEWGSVACYPEHPAWNAAASAIDSCFSRIGSDLRLGLKLPAMMRAAGVEVTHIRPCSHALRAGEPMHFHVPLTLAAMRSTVVAQGLLDPGTLDQTVATLNAHLQREDAVSHSFTMVQIVGRTPA